MMTYRSVVLEVVWRAHVHVLRPPSQQLSLSKTVSQPTYGNTISIIVAAIQSAVQSTGEISPSLIADGKRSHGITGNFLIREVLGQSDVGDIGE